MMKFKEVALSDASTEAKVAGLALLLDKELLKLSELVLNTKKLQGPKGEQGLQGPKGEQGDRGFDGTNGKDGANGADGRDGEDGKQGVGVRDAHIDFDGSLVIVLTDGTEINAGDVVPMDVAEKIKVIGNGGGTSQAVLDAIDAINAVIATYGTMALQDDTSVDINGGAIDGTTVGATTASSGAFTTLSASSTVSGTGFSTYLASPPAIGGTTPAAGTFTTLNSTSGALNGTVGATTANTGKFTTLEATGTSSLGTASAQYMQVVGDANYPALKAAGSGTNIPAVVQPKGTGALQAQQTTSTATGGNARGANAVDWQTSRSTAAQVASAAQSVIGGGYGNLVNGGYGVVAGGYVNSNSSYIGVISGGRQNTIGASGGLGYSVISGGWSNTANGIYNFIGGGYGNSGTSNSAATTQSATMNGTTAVTLSGSNASIKVGQSISGTYINENTYVAAVSGTSLTLSTAATGSGTATLSFYTPHGVVVGGGNNQATGSYSFIGGGGDAGTAANRNVASGDWSFVGGGRKNTASGLGSFVGGGGTEGTNVFPNIASGTLSVVIGGWNNSATNSWAGVLSGQSNVSSGSFSLITGGSENLANSSYGVVNGGQYGFTRSIVGSNVSPACVSPIAGVLGVSQAALLVLGKQTTDATPTVLSSNSGAATSNNQVILPNNSAYYFRGTVVAGKTAGGDTKGWTIEGVIKRGANAASTTVVGVTVASMYADAGAVTWTIAAAADTTNGGLKITATGQAATTIRWVCKIETTEMTY